MTDEQEILKTFEEYSKKFQPLKSRDVMGYCHYPSILISVDKAAALKNQRYWVIVDILSVR